MKKMFQQITDISGKINKYPIAESGTAFFMTQDNRFFIYALYTKKDLSGRKLIEVTYDTYLEAIALYKNEYKKDPSAIILESKVAVEAFTAFTRYKATVDNTTLDDLYKFSYKGD